MIRAFKVEWARAGRDSVFGIYAALVMIVPLTFPRGSSADVLGLPFVVTVVCSTIAASFGAFRITLDVSRGLVRSDLTRLTRTHAFIARAVRTLLEGALLGGALAVVSALSVGMDLMADLTVVLRAGLVAGSIFSMWGFGLGLLIRRHLLAMFIVPCSIAAMLLCEVISAPREPWTLLGSLVTMVEGGAQLAGAVVAAWTAVVLSAGLAVFRSRDE